MKVDFDLALLVLASGLYRRVAQRMRSYDDAQARQIFRDVIDMPATVKVTPSWWVNRGSTVKTTDAMANRPDESQLGNTNAGGSAPR